MKESVSVAVAGASGYAGGEVLRLATRHPRLRIGALTGHSSAGARVGAIHPHLQPLAKRVIEPTSPEALAGHDVVVLALPHGASGAIAAGLPSETLVLDLGADHRLEGAADWERFYGSKHSGTWTYGLPELADQRSHIADSRRIAVPGCNVIAVTLGLQPGIAEGLIEPQDIVAVLANGYSGAGRTLKPHLMAAEALSGASPYAVGGVHRHIPEIVQNLRKAARGGSADVTPITMSFTPTLVPMSRGILATATARLTHGSDEARVRQAWEATYGHEPFVHLLPPGQWPSTASVLGSNAAQVQVAVDVAAQRVVTVTVIDNLVKGTAGTAIQCLNLAMGWPETLGLDTVGVAP